MLPLSTAVLVAEVGVNSSHVFIVGEKGNDHSVRVKGGMSLRNGMWHGLRNDIIMRNVMYTA